jgi:hypothetical protein
MFVVPLGEGGGGLEVETAGGQKLILVADKILVTVGRQPHSNMEELRSTCRDVLTEARRLGVKLPRLEAASSLFSPPSVLRLSA